MRLLIVIAIFSVSACGGYEGKSVQASVAHMTMEPHLYDGAKVSFVGHIYQPPSGGLSVALTSQHVKFGDFANSVRIFDASAFDAIYSNPDCMDTWVYVVGHYRIDRDMGAYGVYDIERVRAITETGEVLCYVAVEAT